jgi:hypothetical protein
MCAQAIPRAASFDTRSLRECARSVLTETTETWPSVYCCEEREVLAIDFGQELQLNEVDTPLTQFAF